MKNHPTAAAAARRGDLVALETRHSVTYAIGSGKAAEAYSRFRIVRVAKASRTGEVKAIEEIGYGLVRQLDHLGGQPRVHCLPRHQEQAERLLGSLSQDAVNAGWDNVDALKSALLAA